MPDPSNAADNPQTALGPLGQVSRSVRDVDESVRWYGDVVGLEHLYTYGDLAFFDLGGTRLYLQAGAATNESTLYLRVGDIHASHANLQARGVAFDDEPHLIHTHDDGTQEWMTFFRDPEGRPLALMSQVAPSA